MSVPTPISTTESFFCGGLAACVAVTISNPAEVAKTRLQLQGELAKGGGQRVYNSAVDVLRKTWRNEGIRGVQRGLAPGYVYQILLNGSRLGFYEPIRSTVNALFGYDAKQQVVFTSVLSGAASGVVGGTNMSASVPMTFDLTSAKHP
ncbi:Mitochondrial oxaloacetate carrier protein [Serendipita sp. 401]|nr:Mitochondrial oxaloacetate carrier protein [Serendipita sp. 401]KAG8839802.1 Mitochondrial oxaloacetate carrier protein [Serendipita sp. 400]KAG9053478.1 Mitochondrial oxaloacetate carrier protein [Serendipita sp. 407]